MLNLATSCVSPSVLCLPSSFWQHWLFAPSPCNKRSVAEALSPRRRTAQVDKRVGPPPALGRTGPQCLQCVTCVSQRLFHADDHITSVPHKQGGGWARHVHLLLLSDPLAALCHPVAFITFLRLSRAQSPTPPSVFQSWRSDGLTVSLWEMSPLMWRVGLVPYSSESL